MRIHGIKLKLDIALTRYRLLVPGQPARAGERLLQEAGHQAVRPVVAGHRHPALHPAHVAPIPVVRRDIS